jgi:hypothetical protein
MNLFYDEVSFKKLYFYAEKLYNKKLSVSLTLMILIIIFVKNAIIVILKCNFLNCLKI